MDPGLPQDLVGEEVPHPCDERLVHERGLDAASTQLEELQEVPSRDVQRVWAEGTEKHVDVGCVSRQPQAAELPHVPVPNLAPIEDEDDPVVPVAVLGVLGPLDLSGHAEVDQRTRAVGPRDQPLPTTLRFVETAAAKRAVELVGRNVSKDPRVGHDDLRYPSADGMFGEPPPERLDVRELGHDGSLHGGAARAVSSPEGECRSLKNRGILHPRLARIVTSMGHGDTLCIADAGLPIPNGIPRIDLAFAPGRPPFLDVLDAVLTELRVERYAVAKESAPDLLDALRVRLTGAEVVSVTHEELKQLTNQAKAVVRTGEFTPYANVILYSGVDFTSE